MCARVPVCVFFGEEGGGCRAVRGDTHTLMKLIWSVFQILHDAHLFLLHIF